MRLINSEVTSTFKVLEMKSRMKKIGEMLSFQIFGGSKFMALKLMKGSLQYKNQIIEMIKEWKSYNDTHDANTSPWAIFKNDYDDFEYYLNNLEISTTDDGFVPDSTFFCLDEDRDLEFLESTPKTLINSLHATARNFDTPSYWTLTTK